MDIIFTNILYLVPQLPYNQEHERINNRYQCPLCPKDYNSLTNLTMHVKSDHLNVRKKCDICDKTYSLFGYQSHMQAMHESGKSDTLLKVGKCQKQFLLTSILPKNELVNLPNSELRV